MTDKLLPCPFCGSGYVELFRAHGEECNLPTWRAWCKMCGGTGNKSNKKKEAATLWNRRTPDARLEAERAVIEAAKEAHENGHYDLSHPLIEALANLARTEKK